MKSLNNSLLILLVTLFCKDLQAQQIYPVWPLDAQWNQINCTFAEWHTAFHGALDINLPNNINFMAIFDGRVLQDADGNFKFMVTDHNFADENDLRTNYVRVRYGDNTDPLSGIHDGNNNQEPSIITAGQEIGKSISGGHLHFEMWARDCPTMDCPWYREDPLNNTHYANFINRPPGYNDVWAPEINDIIMSTVDEPQGIRSGIIYNATSPGLSSFHGQGLKIHINDRPDSQGTEYDGSSYIGLFGSIKTVAHVRDILVTNGVNSVGEGLGIYECLMRLDGRDFYRVKFDEIEQDDIRRPANFFQSSYNGLEGTSKLYGNHDYLKMYRSVGSQISAPHKRINDIPTNGIWSTRLHKSKSSTFAITPTDVADYPSDLKYKEGKHTIVYNVRDANNQEGNATLNITIDNFMPYIDTVEVSKSWAPAGPFPANAFGVLYRATSRGHDDNLSTVGDGKVKFTKEINNKCWTPGCNLIVKVTTSEPLQSLTCKIAGILQTPLAMSSSNGRNWHLTIPHTQIFALSVGTYQMEFKGSDMSGNTLLNVRTYPTDSQNEKEITIPARIATSGTQWSPNPTPNQIGKDTYHSFTIKEGCYRPAEIQEDLEIRTGSECPVCSYDESFSITQTKIIGGNGKTQVTLNTNASIPNGFISIWKDKGDKMVGTGSTQILEPGDYCVEITYNECCEVRLCFEIEGCGNIVQDVVISPTPNPVCSTPGPWEVELILKEGETLKDNVEWHYNNQPLSGDGLFLQISESGIYTYRLTTSSGCSAEGTFSIEEPKLYNSIQG